MPFDDGRLDDQDVLTRFDVRLRHLAESGARVRREAATAAEAVGDAVRPWDGSPRAVLAAGPDSRLLRAVLEPFCPVPFVAWPGAGLPAWLGSMDLVVVLAPEGQDPAAAAAVAEAGRRGCPVVLATPARSLVAEHTVGRYTTLLPSQTGDQMAVAIAVLELLDRWHLAPPTDAEVVAATLDEVAVECSPHRDLSTNPAKILAIGIAESNPLLWGGSVLAARAARRIAESVRRATGRAALAADAEHLLPVLEAASPADVFADPFADGGVDLRPVLVVLDDGSETVDDLARHTRDRLERTAEEHGVRVQVVAPEVRDVAASDVARYAGLLLTGTYAAAYLQIGSI